jgi:hypothetical protein
MFLKYVFYEPNVKFYYQVFNFYMSHALDDLHVLICNQYITIWQNFIENDEATLGAKTKFTSNHFYGVLMWKQHVKIRIP